MIYHRRCDEPTCLYPFTGTTKSKHKAEFYSHGHGFQGALVRVHRRSDGMIPYPCGLEEHARYSFEKLTNLTKQNPHPGPDASEWADHPVEELRNNLPPLPLPLSTMPLLEPTTLETHTFDSFGNDELSSLQTGQLQESDMADENLCNGNEVELPVEEEESAGGMDVGVIDEINAGNGLEDDGEESDESDVLSDDKAEPIEGDDMNVDLAPSSLPPSEILSSFSEKKTSMKTTMALASTPKLWAFLSSDKSALFNTHRITRAHYYSEYHRLNTPILTLRIYYCWCRFCSTSMSSELSLAMRSAV
ncbi:hypothetical protein F5879DRAFT_990565 [Lentinula edodes]|nr:hypothetical protein F5879DRAFT_990565 [Lentinula edodes]